MFMRLDLIRKLRGESNIFRTSVSLPPRGGVKMRLFGETRIWDSMYLVYQEKHLVHWSHGCFIYIDQP